MRDGRLALDHALPDASAHAGRLDGLIALDRLDGGGRHRGGARRGGRFGEGALVAFDIGADNAPLRAAARYLAQIDAGLAGDAAGQRAGADAFRQGRVPVAIRRSVGGAATVALTHW